MNRLLAPLTGLALASLLAACGSPRKSVVVQRSAGATAPAPARAPLDGSSYVVRKGDTLYSIAFRKGVDFRELARWNGIADPYTIWPGQRLALVPPARPATPAAPAPRTPAVAAVAAPPRPATTLPSAVSPPVVPPPTAPSPTVAVPAPKSAPPPAVVAAPTPTPPPSVVVPAAGSRSAGGVNWRWPADGALIGRFRAGDAMAGIQIAGKSGDPVRAAADGVVVYSGNGLVGYGELVIVKHNDNLLSAYGHNRKRLVKEGQRVASGQQIAEMGSTGTTRDELEFQIRKDGNPVDPLGYLPTR